MVIQMAGEVAIVVVKNGVPVCSLSPEKFKAKFGFYPKTTKIGEKFTFEEYTAHAVDTSVSV